ncbi:MAG: hypothetical protein NZ920_00165 [Aigarchaeota archaeon]|nr:hypothetical protein [Aigarchaeota archaeon]MDW8092775.1 hypothetical protein [Nitrososphaerota archaeon]
MIVLDADVLIVHHVPTKDERYGPTEMILKALRGKTKGITIYSLLDLVSNIASVIGEAQSREVYTSYLRGSEYQVLFPEFSGSWEEHVDEVLPYLIRGLSYRDSLTALTLDAQYDIEAYLTWRPKRFLNRVRFRVMNPEEFLRTVV